MNKITTKLLHCRIGVILILILFSLVPIEAQYVDSLRAILKTDIPDTTRGLVYNKLSDYFNRRDVDLASKYLDTVETIDAYVSLPGKEMELLVLHGLLADRRQVFDTANMYYRQAIALQRPVFKDSTFLAEAYYRLGNMNRRQGKNEKAIENLILSKEIFHKLNNPNDAAGSDVVLGIIYQNSGQYEKAIKYYTSAYNEFKNVNHYDNMASCILNIAVAYGRQKNHEAALLKYDEAEKIAQNVSDNEGLLAYIYGNRSNANAQLKRPEKAYENGLLAYELRKEKGSPEERATSLANLGAILIDLGRDEEALIKMEEAKKIVEESDGMLETKRRIYGTLFYFYKDNNWNKKATDAASTYITLKDSLRNIELEKKVLELNEKYESEKKETEIELLNTKNELSQSKLSASRRQTYGLLGGLLLFGGLLFNTFRLNRKTQSQNVIISKSLDEKEILLREIHHRVKNNLQFISSLLGLQTEHISDQKALNALQEGQDRVQSMALIHQNLYQEDNLTGVDMKDYFVKLIHSLFDSYNIREDQVALQLEIGDLNLDVDTVIPIGLIVNELISNSLKYAFPDDRKGVINISLSEAQGILNLTVKDDGIGFPQEINNRLGDSFGYKLIHAFTEQLEADLKIDGLNGTRVDLKIKSYELV